jgi:hypothetical protein
MRFYSNGPGPPPTRSVTVTQTCSKTVLLVPSVVTQANHRPPLEILADGAALKEVHDFVGRSVLDERFPMCHWLTFNLHDDCPE